MKNISLLLVFLLVLGNESFSQLPVVTVRFANPQYNGTTQTYAVDVEFKSNTANQKVYGMNVRFFYDDAVLEYQSMGNFVAGYGQISPIPPSITTSSSTGGSALFGMPANHPFEFFNGAIQMTGSTSLLIPTSGWARIFTMWFHVDDPAMLNIASFCPSLIWDLESIPANGGWLNGDDGVVITVVAPPPSFSAPSTENVAQYNWQYSTTGGIPYGAPVSTTCIATIPLTSSITAQTTAVCAGSANGSATVTATGGNVPYTYKWSTSPIITTATATGLASGNYTVTVTDASNNSTTSSLSIGQNPLPQMFTVTGTGNYCSNNAGLAVGLGGSQTGVNYKLNGSALTVPGTGSSISFGLQTAGNYTITATNPSTGCISMMTGNAVITATQPLPVGISIVSNSSVLASDEAVTLSATPTNGGTAPAYQWKVNGVNAGLNSSNYTYIPENGDAVNCVLTSSESCVSGNQATSNTVIMEVQLMATNQTVTGVLVSGESTCFNATQTLTVAGSGSQFTVLSDGAATLIAGHSIVFLPGTHVFAGGYMDAYITTDNQYCGQQPPTMPSTATEITENVQENLHSSFTIYPNPAIDNFTVEQKSDIQFNSADVLIFGMRGEKVMSFSMTGEKKHQVNITDLKQGLYFVNVIADGNTETFKLIRTK